MTAHRLLRAALAAVLLLPAACKREKKNPFLSTPTSGVSSVGLNIQSVDATQSPYIKILLQVTDGSGNSLANTGFKLGDFSVLEDGKPVVPEEVTSEPNLPLAIVLVIDRSGSMSTLAGSISRNQAATNAGVALVNGMGATDQVAYVEFDSAVTVKVGFTTDKSTLLAAINAGQPGSATAFFDGVVGGAQLLDSMPNSRKLLIALGDGDDNSSTNTLQSAIDAVLSRGITAFTVVLGLDVADVSNFSKIADETDGTFTQSADGSDLVTLFPTIPRQFVNLIGVRYRRRSNGNLTVYLNWGTLTATATRQFTP